MTRLHTTLHTTTLLTAVAGAAAPMAATTTMAAPTQAERHIDDADITFAIDMEFLASEAVPGHRIDVNTINGVVTLAGTVDTLLAKRRAVEIAESMKGVRSVVDRTEVPKSDRADNEIAADVRAAFIDDPATESYEINTTVTNGYVTLKGEVDSWQEKSLAETVATGVRGVRGVTNDIKVNYTSTRPATEIRHDILGRLKASVWIDDEFIDVHVNDAEVKLTGSVGSAIERSRAIAAAWVAGVRSVNAENLNVAWWAGDDMRRESRVMGFTDTEAKEAIIDALTYDPRVASANIDATVKNGVATLTGTVNDLAAKRAAERDAMHTNGVWRVRNFIRVRPHTESADAAIEAAIRRALARDAYTEAMEIDVDVTNGKATLSGEVDSSFERNRAEIVASTTRGVIEIDNNIDYDHLWEWKPDRWILDDVREQLVWSPFVDRDQVVVTVEDGVVTLTGTVDSMFERDMAAENAFDGGARDVRNRLRVSLEDDVS